MSKIRIGFIASLVIASFAIAGTAAAGLVGNTQVTVVSGTSGKGALTAVRNSADSVQYIGCSRYSYSSGSTSAICYARDSSYNYISCSTSNPEHLQVIDSLNPAAYLYFTVNGSTCDSVITTLTSYNLPGH